MLLKAMNLSTMVPWSELGAYVGYTFLHACVVLLAGMIGGACSAMWLIVQSHMRMATWGHRWQSQQVCVTA